MEIFVKSITGVTITLDVDPWDTIENLKQNIFNKEGFPPEHQSLFYSGNLLENIHTLFFYNIKNDATIHLVIDVV